MILLLCVVELTTLMNLKIKNKYFYSTSSMINFPREEIDFNIVAIGDLHSGKLTTTGHLIYKCGSFHKGGMEKLRRKEWRWR